LLQADKDYVEIVVHNQLRQKLTKILSDLHVIVILIVYAEKKSNEVRTNENKAQ
jgi:hypothetical protein